MYKNKKYWINILIFLINYIKKLELCLKNVESLISFRWKIWNSFLLKHGKMIHGKLIQLWYIVYVGVEKGKGNDVIFRVQSDYNIFINFLLFREIERLFIVQSSRNPPAEHWEWYQVPCPCTLLLQSDTRGIWIFFVA